MDVEDEYTKQKIQKVACLKSWLLSLGCSFSPKVFYPYQFSSNLYGMIATADISPGEVLILIKPEAIFSSELLQFTPIQEIFSNHPDLFNQKNPEWLDNQLLTLFLYEKAQGESSKWSLFFASLPESSENLADWSDSEILELQDPDVFNDIQIRREKNFECYSNIKSIISLYPKFFPYEFTITEIEWCWKMIWTRSFMHSAELSALVPYADFINHGPSSTGFFFVDQKEDIETDADFFDDDLYGFDVIRLNCKDLYEINFCAYENIEEETFEVAKQILIEANAFDNQLESKNKAKKEKNGKEDLKNSEFVVVCGQNEGYAKGSQIFIEYGNYSNTSLLIHYGFVVRNNAHEFFRLNLSWNEVLDLSQLKHLSCKYNPSTKLVFYLTKNELCRDFLRTLRGLNWKPFNKTTSFFSQSDLNLELLVLKKYKKIVKKTLNNYPTTLVEDLEIQPKTYKEEFWVLFT